MKQHEKRGAPRVPYSSEMVCENGGNRLIARISDISASGAFIHSKLWCEAGTLLTLSFSVSSTQIEASGEVCYSIPFIGMGVRFVDLKPEDRAVIERLIESKLDAVGNEKVKTKAGRTINCGVEPVDKLLGGLERGRVYLAHGDASGKSLVGIEFLIEGLKHGRHGVLITTQRRDDIVRRFGHLGYDCEKDIRSGALTLFKYSADLSERIQDNLGFEALLSELGPILDKSSPERIVVDPVDHLLVGAKSDEVRERANQLALWFKSLGATVVLVASEENQRIIESLAPAVRNSFRFEVRERSDRVVRFMVFEKSPTIPDQAVRVDPSRGISLFEGPVDEMFTEETGPVTAANCGELESAQTADLEVLSPEYKANASLRRTRANPVASGPQGQALDDDTEKRPLITPSGHLDIAVAKAAATDAFFAMLDELESFVSAVDPDAAEEREVAGRHKTLNQRLPEPEPEYAAPTD